MLPKEAKSQDSLFILLSLDGFLVAFDVYFSSVLFVPLFFFLPTNIADGVSEILLLGIHLHRSYSRNDFVHHHEPFIVESGSSISELDGFFRQ